jgi:cytochrome c oxidase subunit 2
LPPLGLFLLLCGGCGGPEDSLSPQSHQVHDIALLFWWMLAVAAVGMGLVIALLLLSFKRRHRRGLGRDTEGPTPGERASWYVVIGAGIALPIVLIVALFVISNVFIIRTTQAPAASSTRLTVEVVGHEWWWEVRYPGTRAVTANEIHIPVDTPVRLEVRTADVIHSFWVPRLNRKIDAIPDQTNVIELHADAPGRYRGECTEFCGLQHAHMGVYVFAEPPAQFRRWLARQSAPAASPNSAQAQAGRQAFVGGSCASCHAIRGTAASGDTGPDLTHLASRTTIGALTAPQTAETLRAWIVGSQHLKPGNQMPDIRLPDDQVDALVAYLKGLR